MIGDHARCAESVVSRIALALLLAIVLVTSGRAQPCNPAIGGTYCASQPDPSLKNSAVVSGSARDDGLGASLMSHGYYDSPGMFAGITFKGDGTRCIGLLFRGRCN